VEDVVRLLLLDTLVVLELVLRLVLLVLLLVPDVDVLVALVEDVTWQRVRNFEIPRRIPQEKHGKTTMFPGLQTCQVDRVTTRYNISQSGNMHSIVWIWITHGSWS